MSAMRIIHEVEKKGGIIKSFKSSTGALPALEEIIILLVISFLGHHVEYY